MNEDREYRPQASQERLTSDMQLWVVSSVMSYSKTPRGAILCVPIVRGESDSSAGEELGLLWFADDEDAAGYVARQDMAPESVNVGIAWTQRLRAAKKDGLDPAAARSRLIEVSSDPVLGHAYMSRARVMDSLQDLKRVAGI